MPQRGRTQHKSSKKTKLEPGADSRPKGGTRTNNRSSGGIHAKDALASPMTDDEARVTLEASKKLYYRIGEVSELTGVKAHVLRYWETEFRWMAPPKSRSKQRLYRKRDIEFVWLLKRLLWNERYTIAGARQRIQELGVEDALQLLSPPAAEAISESTSRREENFGIDLSSFEASLCELRSELVSLREQLAAPL